MFFALSVFPPDNLDIGTYNIAGLPVSVSSNNNNPLPRKLTDPACSGNGRHFFVFSYQIKKGLGTCKDTKVAKGEVENESRNIH